MVELLTRHKRSRRIHVPRVGDDACIFIVILLLFKFLSTSPVWGTTLPTQQMEFRSTFLSTSPVWGTTQLQHYPLRHLRISIHVPRVGDDSKCDQKAPVCFAAICYTKIHYTNIPPPFCAVGICTRRLAASLLLFSRCEAPAFFCPLGGRTSIRACSFGRILHSVPPRHTSKTSSCGHCGVRPICSIFVLYWLPSR